MRYRLRWAKRGKLRFLSHHDEALVFERSARRARLPLSYSQGYSPRPRIAFGIGLPVGYHSEVELLDVGLDEVLAPEEVVTIYNRGLPEGLRILAAGRLRSGATSLSARIVAADYLIRSDASWMPDALERFMQMRVYEFERPYKGAMRQDDLRAGVMQATVEEEGLAIRCALKPHSTRPSDVLQVLHEIASEPRSFATFERMSLLAESGDQLVPLDETWDAEVAA